MVDRPVSNKLSGSWRSQFIFLDVLSFEYNILQYGRCISG